jgi:recombination protein RecA
MSTVSLRDLLASGRVWRSRPNAAAPPSWSFGALAGRYVELAARGPAARLTIAGQLVLEAQRAHAAAAWVTAPTSSFFPPDLAENGVDLDALVVVRAPHGPALLRATETLLRAGALGLVVVDLESCATPVEVSLPVQTRLVGLAQRHAALLLCLTGSDHAPPHALASLRVEATLRGLGSGRFETQLEAVKDKRANPGWQHVQTWRGMAGLR